MWFWVCGWVPIAMRCVFLTFLVFISEFKLKIALSDTISELKITRRVGDAVKIGCCAHLCCAILTPFSRRHRRPRRVILNSLLTDLGSQGFARQYLQIDYRIWNVPHDGQPNNLRQLREAIVTECRNIDQNQQSNVLLTAWSHEQHVASMQEDMLLKMNRRSTLENERVVLRCCLHYYI